MRKRRTARASIRLGRRRPKVWTSISKPFRSWSMTTRPRRATSSDACRSATTARPRSWNAWKRKESSARPITPGSVKSWSARMRNAIDKSAAKSGIEPRIRHMTQLASNGGRQTKEIDMRAGYLTLVVAIWAGSIAVSASAATAEGVPLPIPAPQPKMGGEAPSTADVLRPPGSIPNARPAPAASAAPTTTATTPPAPRAGHSTDVAAGPPAHIVIPEAKPAATAAQSDKTTAFDATQRALIDRVSKYLSSVHTLVGNFVQVGPDGSRTDGQFYLEKPGRVRFEYNPPSPIDVKV